MDTAGKYILHFGNITGMPYLYARSLERVGIPSLNVLKQNRDFGTLNRQLPYDRALAGPNAGKLGLFARGLKFLVTDVLPHAQLVHFYSESILGRFWDARLLHMLGRPMVITFGGTDVRITAEAQKNNPYFVPMPYAPTDAQIKKRLEIIGRSVDCAATDFELCEYVRPYFRKVLPLRQPIDLDLFPAVPSDARNEAPVVLHLPTHREFKGTQFIEAAVERLKREGLKFTFVCPEPRMTQQQARELIRSADIVVDQLRCGAHGVFAVEAMASARPTICYIREDLSRLYPATLPIVNANPDTIYDRLKELIRDADLRQAIGRKSLAYVQQYHSLDVIGLELKRIYDQTGISW